MITLKYHWATMRRNELLTQLDQTRNEIDFLLAGLLTGVNKGV